MADTINVTQGAGTIIATDDLGAAGHAQRIKLLVGVDGTGTDASGGSGATASNTLRVVSATDDPIISAINSTNTQLPTALVGTHMDVVPTMRSDLMYAGADVTPKFAIITASSSGNTNVVAAVGGKKIRVLAYSVTPNAAVNFKWVTDAAGTPADKTGLKYLAGQGNGIVQGFNPVGWFESSLGKSLDINLSSAVAVGGELVYIEV